MQTGLNKKDFYLFNGVNAYREANRLPKNALYYAENSRFSGGRWGSRKGYQAFGDELTGGTNIKSVMNYQQFPGGIQEESVVAFYDGKFSKYDLATAVETEIVATGWAGGDISTEGISYNASLYTVNNTDRIGKLTDTTFSVLTSGPRPYLIETCFEKMFGVEKTAPSTVQYTATATASEPANIEDWTTTGSAGAQLLGKGGRIECLRRLNNELNVYKQDQIDRFTGFDISGDTPVLQVSPVAKGTGAVNNRSVVNVENDQWFLTPSLEIRSFGQQSGFFEEKRTADMTAIIQRHKRDLDSDQSSAVAWYNKGIYKIALKERASSQNNIIFAYDRDTQMWDFDRATSPTSATVAAGEAYFSVEGTSGQLYKDETGYSDNGFPMGWGGKTGLFDDGQPNLYRRGRYLYVRGARSEGVVITFYLLGEDFQRLETLTLPAPTETEIATGSTLVSDAWGQVGDIVGGEGYQGGEDEGPAVYRYNYEFSVNSNDRMFGIEVESSLNGQRAYLDEAKLYYITRSKTYSRTNA